MPTDPSKTAEIFDLNLYLEDFYKRLPEPLQTDEMRASISQHILELIVQAIHDYMTIEDVERFVESPEINEENINVVLGKYIEEHPELNENIMEEIETFERLILGPAK